MGFERRPVRVLVVLREALDGREVLLIEQGAEQWTVRQILDDPAGDHDWGISATVDLAASDEAGEAVIRVTRVDRL